MELGELIRSYREENGYSQRDFAKLCGLSNATVSYIERNENPATGKPLKLTFDTYYKIARVLQIDIGEMLKRLDNAYITIPGIDRIEKDRMHAIPVIGEVAAGEPITASEDGEDYVYAPEKADYALKIRGESMVPTYLPDDIVYIREQPDIDYPGQVAVVLLDNEATVKHVYKQPDSLLLISDNPDYAPMVKPYADYASIRILGKVCGFTRMYK